MLKANVKTTFGNYRLTNITLSALPRSAPLLIGIARCNNLMPTPSPKLLMIAVENFLGDTGQLVRMMQLTLDSWLVVGY